MARGVGWGADAFATLRKEAALAVGEIATPIVDTVIKLAPVLGVKLPG